MIARLSILAFWLVVSTQAYAMVIDKVVAVVNEDIVTESELKGAMAPMIRQYQEQFSGEELRLKLHEVRKKVLGRLIDDWLVYQDALKQNISVRTSEVDEAVQKIRSRFPDLRSFEQALNAQGVTEASLRQKLQRQLFNNRYKKQIISRGVQIDPLELQSYYDKHKDDFIETAEVRPSQIFLPWGEDKAYARSKMNEIQEALKNGEAFSQLARQFSKGPNAEKGGDLGFLKKGQVYKDIEDAVFTMSIGQISEIIESPSGLHLLKLMARKEPYQLELKEVQDKVRGILFAQKAEQRYFDTIEELRKNAYIEIKDPMG